MSVSHVRRYRSIYLYTAKCVVYLLPQKSSPVGAIQHDSDEPTIIMFWVLAEKTSNDFRGKLS